MPSSGANPLGPRLYRNLVESAPDAMLLLDSKEYVRLANQRAEHLFGYPQRNLIGLKAETLLPEAPMPGEGVAGSEIELKARRQDGSVFPVEIRLSPLVIRRENCVAASIRDITARKEAEARLRVSETRYRRLFEATQDGILIVDAETGLVTDVNPYLLDLLGYSKNCVIGKKLWELGPYADLEASKAIFRQLQINKCVRYENLPLQTRDGEDIDVEFVSSLYKVDNERFIQCNIRDISERRLAERELAVSQARMKESNQELEQFAYSAAHDLKEPLRSVIGFGDLLRLRWGDKLDQEGREWLGLMTQSARHMQALINDLLAYSRIGHNGSDEEPIDCERELALVESQLCRLLDERQAVISHDPLPTVTGSRVEFSQLMQNLISNAIKFQPGDHPKVHISCRQVDDGWEFSVHDEGIGIPADQHKRIFQLFRRLHPSSEYEGSGVGLTLCEKIVGRMGGRIWVESEPGQGSTFYFTIKAK